MKLWHAAASPFVRKVMIVAHETGQADDIEILAASTTPVKSRLCSTLLPKRFC